MYFEIFHSDLQFQIKLYGKSDPDKIRADSTKLNTLLRVPLFNW
jgi:hypothetical protein